MKFQIAVLFLFALVVTDRSSAMSVIKESPVVNPNYTCVSLDETEDGVYFIKSTEPTRVWQSGKSELKSKKPIGLELTVLSFDKNFPCQKSATNGNCFSFDAKLETIFVRGEMRPNSVDSYYENNKIVSLLRLTMSSKITNDDSEDFNIFMQCW